MNADERTNTQVAPYPEELEWIVDHLTWRPGFTFELAHEDRGQGSQGLTFTVFATVEDSLNPDRIIRVRHLFPVPPAAYNRASWTRWVFDRCCDVDRHEACEYFRVAGERIYAPHHSEGEDPYIVWQLGDYATANKRSTDK